jgi:LysM repeat protein
MWANAYVCVGVPGASHVTSTPSPTPTTVGPQPQMPGVTTKCRTYYYVNSGDSCWSIEQAKGVSLDQLRSWNTGINSDCTNLWANAYICVSA